MAVEKDVDDDTRTRRFLNYCSGSESKLDVNHTELHADRRDTMSTKPTTTLESREKPQLQLLHEKGLMRSKTLPDIYLTRTTSVTRDDLDATELCADSGTQSNKYAHERRNPKILTIIKRDRSWNLPYRFNATQKCHENKDANFDDTRSWRSKASSKTSLSFLEIPRTK